MKKAFSLLELIFVIVIISIIASVAIPKFLDTKNTAQVASLKRDISSAISSIQSYYLINQGLDKISDAITLNTSIWNITDKKISFSENSKSCIILEIKDSSLDLTLDDTTGPICKKLKEQGLSSTSYDLY